MERANHLISMLEYAILRLKNTKKNTNNLKDYGIDGDRHLEIQKIK